MENETIKDKLLRRFKLTTLRQKNLELDRVVKRYVDDNNRTIADYSKRLLDAENRYKEREEQLTEDINTLKEDYKRLQKMKATERKKLQERIEALDLQNKVYVDEIGLKNHEISDLQKQIDSLKEEMKGMVKYEVLKSRKPRKTQTMKIKSSTVRSKIARDTVKELEEVDNGIMD